MTQRTIAVIVGSLRQQSLNRRMADALARLGPSRFAFDQVPISDLPLYDQDGDAAPNPAVRAFKDRVAAAQGILLVTPEYNRSVPGVLKNAIDHGSRPHGESVWSGKPAGIVGVSPGAIGTATAQQHLRNILAYLDMPTLGQPEAFIQAKDGLFDDHGNIGPASRDFLQGWMDRFVTWVEHHSG